MSQERSWLARLDEVAFMGIDAWEFSLRSLGRRYGRLFLQEVVVRHPCRVFSGLRQYRTRVRAARTGLSAPVLVDPTRSLPAQLAGAGFIVASGFCEKPLDPPCPAGRFNHRCSLLERREDGDLPPACCGCHIREVAAAAGRAGAAFYIMTSAEDIARDLLLPSIRNRGRHRVVLTVCPYSVPPLTLAMTICGLRGLVLPYAQGDCRSYAAWVRADTGDKPEQTSVAETTRQRLSSLLVEVAEASANAGIPVADRFDRMGNLYLARGSDHS